MSENNLLLSQQFFSSNIIFIEEIYQKFLQNPSQIDKSWVDFFTSNKEEVESILADYRGPKWANRNLQIIGSQEYDISSFSSKEQAKAKDKNLKTALDLPKKFDNKKELQLKIHNLVNSYRRFGHLAASLDPLGLKPQENVSQIQLEQNFIEESDLSCEIDIGGNLGFGNAKISDIVLRLQQLYCGQIGSDFEYIENQEQKQWLTREIETLILKNLDKGEKIKILKEVIRTEGFEQFLHKRFPGAKRFSVEGGDASIASIEKIIDVAARDKVKKIVIGMAHRGRLNTLTGVMKKPYHQMFAEFQGTPGMPEGITKSGDVKYHMGYASSREIAGNKIDLSLAFNPSHLEAVNPVVAGRVRAKQDLFKDSSRKQAMAILIHGDAAFAGQGCVAETLMMSGVSGYDTGGVIHIIINNQIGFTANPNDSRSTRYASDLAKAIDAPIFHVNGDDVEAVVKISDIATRFRQQFKKDVVLDIICYRRYGHNEGDEPLYTQPLMYQKIKNHPTLEKIYSSKLIEEKIISNDEYQKMRFEFDSHLAKEFDIASKYRPSEADWLKGDWKNIKNNDNSKVNTQVNNKTLKELVDKIVKVPTDFNANPKILKQLEARKEAVESGVNIDWGCAESLAFASLLNEGYQVRITGQDAGRGTFSHRHSILHDGKNGSRYNIFSPFFDKAKYEVHDSVLSEYAVLGFEYGYSLSMPYGLTIWEAQFGDFANGAQIIFDQFIASSEVKWLRKSGLVMLLPHGFEGQGPEHSSARLERYLQACADNNMIVCNITTPANFFHALRRQIHGKDRKPLVIMSPKSLLRHKLAVSEISQLSESPFKEIIVDESKLVANDKIRKVILCSGKVYYDLFEARQSMKINDVAIIRVEQIYPYADLEIQEELRKYKNAEIIFCQEEPRNMGSWNFIAELIEKSATNIKHKNPRPKYVGRIACASPATGYGSYHAREQKALIEEALS